MTRLRVLYFRDTSIVIIKKTRSILGFELIATTSGRIEHILIHNFVGSFSAFDPSVLRIAKAVRLLRILRSLKLVKVMFNLTRLIILVKTSVRKIVGYALFKSAVYGMNGLCDLIFFTLHLNMAGKNGLNPHFPGTAWRLLLV